MVRETPQLRLRSARPFRDGVDPSSPPPQEWDAKPRSEEELDSLWRSEHQWNAAGLFEWEGYWVFLSLIQEGRTLEANHLEITGTRSRRHGKRKPITKLEVLRRLPLSNMIDQLSSVYWESIMRYSGNVPVSEDDDPRMARLKEWVGRSALARLTAAEDAPASKQRGRGRPPKPDAELQEVARLYLQGGRRLVIKSNPNYGKSTVDHWIRKCRDVGMLPGVEKKGAES